MKIGIDLGGTKTEIIALGNDGQVFLRERRVSPKNDYQATLHTLCDMVIQAEQRIGESGTVGIATPGAVSPSKGVLRNSNSTWLNGRPLKEDLQDKLAREIRISNDANCFTLSEAVDGAAKHADVVFGVIIGTGTGGGIVVNKKVLQGINAIAGEWGHNPLPWPDENELKGKQCYCGKHGCIETYLSGPGLEADHFRVCEQRVSAEQIALQASLGDKDAINTLARYQVRLAKSLASVINIIDPDVIVLGGGLSNIKSLYQSIPALWSEYVFSDSVATKLLAPAHGDSSGVRGAAWLW